MRVNERATAPGAEDGSDPDEPQDVLSIRLSDDLVDLLTGISLGKDPPQAPSAESVDGQSDGDVDRERLTGLFSPWLGTTCGVCGHTFRLGDPVRLGGSAGDVVHLDPALACGGPTEPDGSTSAALADFAAGVNHVWPPPTSIEILSEGHGLLSDPVGAVGRPTCLMCSHTFRLGELALHCPCGRSPRCLYGVHRDPLRGLTCWEEWQPGGKLVNCPIARREVR